MNERQRQATARFWDKISQALDRPDIREARKAEYDVTDETEEAYINMLTQRARTLRGECWNCGSTNFDIDENGTTWCECGWSQE